MSSKKMLTVMIILSFMVKLQGQHFNEINMSKILPKLFDGKWVKSKQECIWKPNFAENLSFEYYLQNDTLAHTKLDTLIRFSTKGEKRVLLILSTENSDSFRCHFCEPAMSLALFSSPKNEEAWSLMSFKKYVELTGHAERLYDKIEILQIGESEFCLKLSHFTSFLGAGHYSQVTETLYYMNENFKEILTFQSSGSGAILGKNRKYFDFTTSLKLDAKKSTITLQEKGNKSNFDVNDEKIIKMNQKIIYQFDGSNLRIINK